MLTKLQQTGKEMTESMNPRAALIFEADIGNLFEKTIGM